MTITTPIYKDIASKKKLIRDNKFKSQWLIPNSDLPDDSISDVLDWIDNSGYLTKSEIEITNSSAVEILTNIKDQKWTCLDVTLAFCHRSSIAHQLTNCLTEIFYDEAIETAKELDQYQLKHNKTIGPLHGLPISLKDCFNVKGQATTLGMVNFCFNPEKFNHDSTIVTMYRKLGAVLYVKSNTPTAMMLPESKNHIWGNTVNPMNRSLSSGGSSGGEAALIKLKGSPLGIGTDIGGSIRIPASFQNLYSLRPSFGRFPTYQTRSGLPGLESVNSVNGPIGNSILDLEYYCKAIINAEPWLYDAKCVEIPWRPMDLSKKKLNVAVLINDKVVNPTPPIRRGMKIVIEKLKQHGHDVIEWVPVDHLTLSQIITKFFISDGGYHVLKETEAVQEPLFPYMENYGKSKDIGVAKLWQLQNERTILVNDYLKRWNDTCEKTNNGEPIDCIIMPATPFPGNPVEKFHDYVGYTSPFNVVDYAAATFPVTRVDKTIDLKDETSTNYNTTDEKIWRDYDPQESHGGAVALQLIGRRFQEEKVLEMVKLVSDLINYQD